MNAAEDCYTRAAASGHIKASVHLGYLALQQQAWELAEQHFEVFPEMTIPLLVPCIAPVLTAAFQTTSAFEL